MVAQDKGGISAKRVAGMLGMHYATAWTILHKIRIAMGQREENLTLAGYIELDEAFFGGRGRKRKKTTRGKRLLEKKKQVLIMVESEGKQAGNIALVVIPNTTYDTLKPILEHKIESDPPVSHFRTDGLQSHDVVRWLGNKLEMGHIPHAMQDDEFPCLSLATTHLRRFLMGTHHQFCKRHLQRYLDEFAYRWNRRHQWCQIFSRLLTACALSDPTTYAALS
jgi:transposase-like protein